MLREDAASEKRLRDLGLFSLQKRRPQGYSLAALQHRHGGCHNDGARVFTVMHFGQEVRSLS